jgi:hypothetical protein
VRVIYLKPNKNLAHMGELFEARKPSRISWFLPSIVNHGADLAPGARYAVGLTDGAGFSAFA